MQNTYELTLILKASLDEEKRKKIAEDIKKTLGENGKIEKTEEWGKKTFSYPVKKEKEGYYLFMLLEAAGKEAVKLADKLKFNESILRYLLVRRK